MLKKHTENELLTFELKVFKNKCALMRPLLQRLVFSWKLVSKFELR